jgi:hypothetical protein
MARIPEKIEEQRKSRRKHLRQAARAQSRRLKALARRDWPAARTALAVRRRHREAAQQDLKDIRALRAEYSEKGRLKRLARNNRRVIGKSGRTWVDGHQVASWIAVILFEARADGVVFRVTSGERSYATALYLWNNAGRLGLIHYVSVAFPCNSNHCGVIFPKGAVDLYPWQNFLNWLRRQHKLGRHENLKSYHDVVGSRDDVHFSHTGH